MLIKELISRWFTKWEIGDFHNLPVTDNFTHISPFGTTVGKKEYVKLVESNKEKFLGYQFELHDEIYSNAKACVRYTATQGDFKLDVSEWYYIKDNLIERIIAHYHIGEIRLERQLEDTVS